MFSFDKKYKMSIELEMTKVVTRFYQSDQSLKEFSINEGISMGKLHYWIRKLSDSFADPIASAPTASSDFIPLSISNSTIAKGNQIVIRLNNGTTIEIPA